MTDEKISEEKGLGRITGRDVGEIVFRSHRAHDVFLGEMLVGVDDANSRRFLLRVINIQHGNEAGETGWAPRTAGAIMESDEFKEDYDIYDADRRLFHHVICAPLGYLVGEGEKAEFRSPKTIPAHFSKVRRADDEDYRFLEKYLGDVQVGKLRSGEKVIGHVQVGIDSKFVCQHLGIFATTGMGKSNLMKRLAGSILENGKVGLLILDPHGEYYDGGKSELKGLVHHPKAENLRVYSTRELAGTYSKATVSTSEVTVQDVENLWPFSEPQKEFLQAVRGRSGRNWLNYLIDHEIGAMVADFGEQFHEGSIAVVKRRAEAVAGFPFITTDETISMTKTVLSQLHNGLVVLVDLAGSSEKEELLVSSVLARALFEENSRKFRDKDAFSKIPPCLIVLEEAQRVFNKSWGGIFPQLAREGRKFKTGLCAISQQPKLIDQEVISQFNTLVILGLADRMDRERLSSSARQDVSKLDYEIQTLMTGEGLITGPNTPFALPVKVDLYEQYLSSLGKAEKKPKGGDAGFY